VILEEQWGKMIRWKQIYQFVGKVLNSDRIEERKKSMESGKGGNAVSLSQHQHQ